MTTINNALNRFAAVQRRHRELLGLDPKPQSTHNPVYPLALEGYGAATSRAEAQVLRLSTIYAGLDCSLAVEPCHLQAALDVWDYCCASARLFFDTAPIDPTARRISQAFDVNPQGLSRIQIRGLFNRHVSKERIDLALEQLAGLGLLSCDTSSSGHGRPSTVWAKVSEGVDAGH